MLAAGDSGVGNPDIRGVAEVVSSATSNTGVYSNAAVLKQFPNLRSNRRITTGISTQRGNLVYRPADPRDRTKGIALTRGGSLRPRNAAQLRVLLRRRELHAAVLAASDERRPSDDRFVATSARPRTRTRTDTCMPGPRYLDPVTDDEAGQASESRPGINYFANTTTMEYQNERFFENSGLGTYDVMSMGALYERRVLETYDPDAADGVAAHRSAELHGPGVLAADRKRRRRHRKRRPAADPLYGPRAATHYNLYDPDRAAAPPPRTK